MTSHFGLERVNDSPASFDPDKLYWVAGEYMKELPLDQKTEGVLPFLQRAKLIGDPVDDATRQKVRTIVEACGDRIKLFSDILVYGAPFLRKDPAYDPKAVEKRLKKPENVRAVLSGFRKILETAEPFEPEALEKRMQAYAAEGGFNPSLLIHALRVSTTGVEVGPGVYHCLCILGRAETLRRIDLGLGLME